jgi:hypothetical protein
LRPELVATRGPADDGGHHESRRRERDGFSVRHDGHDENVSREMPQPPPTPDLPDPAPSPDPSPSPQPDPEPDLETHGTEIRRDADMPIG